MLQPGLYEQVINEKIGGELNALPAQRCATAAIDKAEASQVLAQYLAEVAQKGLDDLADKGGDMTAQINLVNQLIQTIEKTTQEADFAPLRVDGRAEQLLVLLREKDPLLVMSRTADDLPRPETSLARSSLFTGALNEPQMFSELKKEISCADRIDMLVSFIKWSGLRLILEELRTFTQNGGQLRVISTSYMGATDPKAIEELNRLPNTQIKISYDTDRTRLHAKTYVFYRNTGFTTAYVGSSNLSKVAMSSGLEWNVKVTAKDLPTTLEKISATFDSYWNAPEFELYQEGEHDRLLRALKAERGKGNDHPRDMLFNIHPYAYQQEILDKLDAERKVRGLTHNLVVAATGTGKTVISAFDYRRFCKEHPGGTNRLLFVAHREEILRQSQYTFQNILRAPNFGDLFVGGSRPESLDHLFVSIQTVNSQDLCDLLPAEYYDYIVVDEFHHAAAPTYQRLLDHFRPQLLLGLTATPERMDGKSVLDYFGGRIAAEIRLPEAIDRKLLCPFQYFGVADTIDLDELRWVRGGYDKKDLTNLYSLNRAVAERRAGHILQSLDHYVIVIGPPAAGKSSVLANPLSQKYGSRIIDSDTAKTMPPEFDGGFGAGRVHEESAFIAETLMLRAAVQNGENIVIPWVGKNPQKLRDTLKRLKQNGYSVHLSLNELDPDKAARRAVSRFQNTGRFVDPNYVLSVGWKPSEVYDILKKEGGFDSYVKYSNDVPYGQPARLVEGPGVVEEVQAGRMGRLGGRPGTGNSYRVGYGENATERVSSLDNQAAFSVGEIPYLSEETAETFSEYIPSLMDDASMSVSAPVSGLTRGQATGSALETDIPNGMRERGFAESLRTKSDLPDEVKAEFVDTPEIYRQLSNTETIAKADAAWGNGLEEAQRNFRSLLETRDPAAIPLGKNIADELIRQGKSEDAAQLLRDMSAALTSSGQFSQAAAIALMKEDPMTALSYLQKQIDKMNAEGAKKFGKKWKDFTLTDNEIKAFGDVAKGDEEALKSLYEGVGRRIAKEYPATMKEKVVELSHIAMLLNPRTQVRNVLSNIAMMPATAISDKISAVGQKLYSKANPNFKPELALTASKESKDLAAQVYDRIKGRIDNTASKWENSATQGIREKEMFKGLNGRTAGDIPVLEDVGSRIKGGLNTISQKLTGDSVFDALSSEKSVTENVRQLTYGLLELGDKGFVAQRFKSYLSKAIEASGAKTLDAVPASAIDRAVQEAMKATFKDDNALTRLVSSIKRNTGFIGETLLPFTKTPANVTMRALDYSPAGIASAVKMAKNGTEASAVIDQVAKATTGTLAILLGIGLYNKGIITGPEDEDPDKAAFQKQQGWLPYAVKFGDNYYTYDWAQPGSMGLVLGSTIMSQLDKDGSIEAKDLASIIKNSVSAFGDTLLQQSTLQNLLDVFSGYGSPTENMTNEVLETPQRLIPSLVGATARVADTTQRSTYSKGDFLKTQIDTLKSKIPGLSQTLPATYDTWGNEVQRSGNSLEAAFAQYLNPGQLGYSGGQTPIDEEIMRLYDATNNSGVFPHKADRTVTIAGEEIDLDNQQYSEFQRLLGQASYEAANAFLEMPGYDSLADEQKADALQNAYAAAKDIALSEMFDDYSVPKTRGKYADMYEEFGTDGLALWAYYKQIENWDGEGGVRNEDRKNAIDSLPGLTRAQRSFMWILSNGSETSNPYD